MLLKALWENNVEECHRLFAEGERLRPEEYSPDLTFDQVVFAFMHLDAERVWAGRITHPYLWTRLVHTKAFVFPPRTLPYMILQQSMWKSLGWTPEVDDLDARIDEGKARLNATFQAKFPFHSITAFDNAVHEFRSQMTYWSQTKADMCSVMTDSLCHAVDLRLASESPFLTEEERTRMLEWMTSAIKAYPVPGAAEAFLRGEHDAIFEEARKIPDKDRTSATIMRVMFAVHISVYGEPAKPDASAQPIGSRSSSNPFLPPDGTNPFSVPPGMNPFGGPTPYANRAYRNPFSVPPGMNPYGMRPGDDSSDKPLDVRTDPLE